MATVIVTMADLETAVPLDRALEAGGTAVTLVASADEARQALNRGHPAVLVLTGAVHEPASHALAERARELEVSVLALLEATDSERTVAATRLGATEVLVKPVPTDELAATVHRLVERRELQRRTGIAGDSPAIQEVLIKIEQMAPVTSTVLIEGESGTGKELVAKAIHDLSPRRGKPFIAVNCAALPETLLESELFGHEKGAFTGAAERRLGRFELADTGTIFLDEIGEIPASVQVKLLRVLETRTFFRLGGASPIKVNVRVVAATNRALREQVALGEFRDDLYYRLNVLSIYLPPLRERRADIPQLVRRFVREFAAQHDRPFPGISAEAMERLVEAPWPGNIRQLRNLIESMVVLAPGTQIRAHDIPADITERMGALLPMRIGHGEAEGRGPIGGAEFEFILRSLMELRVQVEELRRQLEQAQAAVEVIDLGEAPTIGVPIPMPVQPIPAMGAEVEEEPEPPPVVWREGMTMADVERATIEAALERLGGNRRRAAQELAIGERTLYRKLKEYGIG
ncbi:MAG TPA: sigma-54 dependent transcriptional regulator [Gemmatimonadales bacterium]|nr:sigma-54-dependent Fis family transcriptional regulator [Gemmatimonadales bacterium]HPF62480.1 sigma-54 dependent transcriptional regulator [Gemmatimonadales bacterium]HRX18997.1 sigma-54 dependent transcriptional regulator [Gemmatimonadales bacterium]